MYVFISFFRHHQLSQFFDVVIILVDSLPVLGTSPMGFSNPTLPPFALRFGFGLIFAGAGYILSSGDIENGSAITTCEWMFNPHFMMGPCCWINFQLTACFLLFLQLGQGVTSLSTRFGKNYTSNEETPCQQSGYGNDTPYHSH